MQWYLSAACGHSYISEHDRAESSQCELFSSIPELGRRLVQRKMYEARIDAKLRELVGSNHECESSDRYSYIDLRPTAQMCIF
jgi:hypothetical protein